MKGSMHPDNNNIIIIPNVHFEVHLLLYYYTFIVVLAIEIRLILQYDN